MSNTRDLSFDFIKGFLIFLVCWGHIIQFHIGEGHLQNETFMLIYSFHMPLFIMISGYFACKSIKVGGVLLVIKTRTKRLLIPAVVWVSIFFVLARLRGETVDAHMLATTLHGAWFLFCLYILYIVASFVWRTNHPYLISGAIALFLYLMFPYWPMGLRHLVYYLQLTRMWPVFVIGIFVCERDILKRLGKTEKGFIIAIASAIYLFYVTSGIFMHQQEWQWYVFKDIAALSATVVWLFTLRLLYVKVSNSIFATILCTLGNATLGVYMLNAQIIRILPPVSDNWFVMFATAILVTALCYAITLLLRKYKYTRIILLGEK